MQKENREQNPQNKILLGFIAVVFTMVIVFVLGILIGTSFRTERANILDKVDAAYLNNILQAIQDGYLGEFPSNTDVTYSLAKGLVESLRDKYSSFLTPEEVKQYYESNDSKYEGIGVSLDFDGEYTYIQSVFLGFPGEKAGLKSGDLLLSIDGEAMIGVRPEIAVGKIKGPAGSELSMQVHRVGSNQTLEVKMKRDKIDLDNVFYQDLGDGIYMISIVKFTEGEEGFEAFNAVWRKIAAEVAAKSPRGLVIDLRNNPGGYVESVKYVLEDFFKDNTVILQEKSKQGGIQKYYDTRRGVFEDLPLAVMVNEGSASASEIFAGAIQDLARGKVIGKPTVGKGVEQIVIPQEDGAMLLLVYKYWLTAGGRQLSEENPIKPDLEIEEGQAAKAKELVIDQINRR